MSGSEEDLTLVLKARDLASKEVDTFATKAQASSARIAGTFDHLGDRLVSRFHRRDVRELGSGISNSILALATGGSLTDVLGAAGLSMAVGLASSFAVNILAQIAGSQLVVGLLGVLSTLGTTMGGIIAAAIPIGMALLPVLIVGAIVAAIVFLINNPEIVNKILEFAGSVLKAIGDGLAALGGLLLGLFGKAWDLVTGAVGAYVQTVANFWLGLPGLLAGLAGAILHVFAMAFAAVLGFVKTIVGTIVGVISGIVGAVRDAISWVDRLIPKINGIPAMPAIPGLPLPHFQAGTPFVPFTGPAIVHRGERIIPAGQNGGDAGHGHDIYLDGTLVGRTVDERLSRRLRRAPTTSKGV